MQPNIVRNIVLGIVAVVFCLLLMVGLVGYAGYRIVRAGLLDENNASEHIEKKEYSQATEDLSFAIEKAPKNFSYLARRGECYLHTGKYTEAVEDFSTAIKLYKPVAPAENGEDSDQGRLYGNRGVAYAMLGKWDSAQEDFKQVEKLSPREFMIYNEMAWMLATCPNTRPEYAPRAVTFANRANALTLGRDSMILDTLAAAYAAKGDFKKAVKTQQEAINLKDEPKYIDEYKTRLKMYKAGKVYREALEK